MSRESDFDRIFRQYYEKLYRFVRQYIAGADDSHDIVTGVFEDVWRNFSSVDIANIAPYLYQTARNRVIDFLRREGKRQLYTAYAMKMSERFTDPGRLAEHEHNMQLIETILSRIGPPTSTVLRACYIDGKKYKEAADELGMSLALVKKHMVKALKMVREIKKTLNA